jgi:hypothetical protein
LCMISFLVVSFVTISFLVILSFLLVMFEIIYVRQHVLHTLRGVEGEGGGGVTHFGGVVGPKGPRVRPRGGPMGTVPQHRGGQLLAPGLLEQRVQLVVQEGRHLIPTM